MSTSVARSAGPIHLGLDTSKDSIAVGILRAGEVSPDAEKIFNDEVSVRRARSKVEPALTGLGTCRQRPPRQTGAQEVYAGGRGWLVRIYLGHFSVSGFVGERPSSVMRCRSRSCLRLMP
jgi:hypothetical protein